MFSWRQNTITGNIFIHLGDTYTFYIITEYYQPFFIKFFLCLIFCQHITYYIAEQESFHGKFIEKFAALKTFPRIPLNPRTHTQQKHLIDRILITRMILNTWHFMLSIDNWCNSSAFIIITVIFMYGSFQFATSILLFDTEKTISKP